MNRALMLSGAVLVAMAAVACSAAEASDASNTMTVHASVTTNLSIDNARAVAIGTDGRTFWAYVDRDRDFTLELPVGQSYRIIVANQRTSGGQRTVGHVVLDGARGTTEWIGANAPGDVDLGKLRLAGTSTTSSGLSTKCGSCPADDGKGGGDDGDKDDYSDDYGTKSGDKGTKGSGDTGSKSGGDTGSKGGDGDKGSSCACDDEGGGDGTGKGKGPIDPDDTDVCTDAGDDKPLVPSKKPAADCSDKDASKRDGKSYGDEKACSGGSGDTGSKPTGGDSGSKPTGGDSGGGRKGEGSKCNASAECTSDCSCVASTCSKK